MNETDTAFRILALADRLGGTVLFVIALSVVAVLERFQFQLKTTEQTSWWVSNGRDALNLLALGAMVAALWAQGFSGPIALATGATLVVLQSLVQPMVDRTRKPLWSSAALAWLFGAPVLISPRQLHDGLKSILAALF